jgi:hypothetical protein
MRRNSAREVAKLFCMRGACGDISRRPLSCLHWCRLSLLWLIRFDLYLWAAAPWAEYGGCSWHDLPVNTAAFPPPPAAGPTAAHCLLQRFGLSSFPLSSLSQLATTTEGWRHGWTAGIHWLSQRRETHSSHMPRQGLGGGMHELEDLGQKAAGPGERWGEDGNW